MDSLRGRGAVVTGAASEIGRATARAFIDAGASVLLCDRHYRTVEVFARQLGDRAIGRVTDVSDERQVAAALRAARAAFGALDIVVNCAGLGAMTPPTGLTALTDENWPGLIINILSVNARPPGEGQAPSCAATAAAEIAATAVYLASEHAGSVRGKSFVIDAGSLTRGYLSQSLMRHGTSHLLQLVNGAIARDWLRGLLMRANALCEEY
jgi:NADP-dependent 3-hydroxy acid dehydrogenase YdfG